MTTADDTRIARALGVTDKTVRAVRRRLEATSEIPRLTTFEGTDGKTRPSTQAGRAIYAASQEDFDWDSVRRLIEQAPNPLSDPFDGCSESEIRDWHLFVLFLVQQCGYSVEGAALHAEWVRRRFQTVAVVHRRSRQLAARRGNTRRAGSDVMDRSGTFHRHGVRESNDFVQFTWQARRASEGVTCGHQKTCQSARAPVSKDVGAN